MYLSPVLSLLGNHRSGSGSEFGLQFLGRRFFFFFCFFLLTSIVSSFPVFGVFSPPGRGVFLNCFAPIAQLPDSRLSTSTEPAAKGGSFLDIAKALERSNLAYARTN